MSQVATVGRGLATNVFQVHGADGPGRAMLRKTLPKTLHRDQVLAFFSPPPLCFFARAACGGANVRDREIGRLGHDVRLIPPAQVKPFVKRQQNDAAEAEAIREAAQSQTVPFVAAKNEETQGALNGLSRPGTSDPAAQAGNWIL